MMKYKKRIYISAFWEGLGMRLIQMVEAGEEKVRLGMSLHRADLLRLDKCYDIHVYIYTEQKYT